MTSLLRGIALFLAMFTAASAAIASRTVTDPNLWWLDLRVFPDAVARGFIVIVILALGVAFLAPQRRWLRTAFRVVLAAAALLALVNAAVFYRLLLHGEIASHFPLPFSLFMAAVLTAIAGSRVLAEHRDRRLIVLGFLAAALLFPLLQVVCFGSTDYRRRADLIVVFGARAYANGAASSPLADRVRTGCELYRAGLAPQILFSGGPGDGALDEPQVMSRLAQRLGVPPSAILLDPAGVNTDATAQNTRALLRGQHMRVLAVSHFYHLPRIKLAFQRAGLEVSTVPSHTTARSALLFNVPRECVAFWAYYARWLLPTHSNMSGLETHCTSSRRFASSSSRSSRAISASLARACSASVGRSECSATRGMS